MTTLTEQGPAKNDDSQKQMRLIVRGNQVTNADGTKSANDLLSALQKSAASTSVRIDVIQSGHEDNKSTEPVQWRPVLGAISAMENLKEVSIASVFDPTGKHSLSLGDLTKTLRNTLNLEIISLDSIGFLFDDLNQFVELEEAFAGHPSLRQVELTHVYFPKPLFPSGMHCCRLTQALSVCPGLVTLRLTAATRYYGRPILTLDCLKAMFAHPRLQHLYLQEMNLWGSGSALQCAKSLRQNQQLQELHLRYCLLAGDGSILSGLDQNQSVAVLDLIGATLHLEAEPLIEAFQTNTKLQKCCISDARLGVGESSHHKNACGIIQALKSHPTMTDMDISGLYDYMYDDGGRPLNLMAEALKAAVQMLQGNKILTTLTLVEETVNKNIDFMVSAVDFYLGLNRSGYWNLSSAHSSAVAWSDAMLSVQSNLGCLYFLLRDNPTLCQR